MPIPHIPLISSMQTKPFRIIYKQRFLSLVSEYLNLSYFDSEYAVQQSFFSFHFLKQYHSVASQYTKISYICISFCNTLEEFPWWEIILLIFNEKASLFFSYNASCTNPREIIIPLVHFLNLQLIILVIPILLWYSKCSNDASAALVS